MCTDQTVGKSLSKPADVAAYVSLMVESTDELIEAADEHDTEG